MKLQLYAARPLTGQGLHYVLTGRLAGSSVAVELTVYRDDALPHMRRLLEAGEPVDWEVPDSVVGATVDFDRIALTAVEAENTPRRTT